MVVGKMGFPGESIVNSLLPFWRFVLSLHPPTARFRGWRDFRVEIGFSSVA